MIGKWKKAVDNNKVFGALLTDLSKAFYCICHDLFVAKLNAQGHHTIIRKILILETTRAHYGPILFNVFLCGLFYEYENNYFASYVR